MFAKMRICKKKSVPADFGDVILPHFLRPYSSGGRGRVPWEAMASMTLWRVCWVLAPIGALLPLLSRCGQARTEEAGGLRKRGWFGGSATLGREVSGCLVGKRP